jgi:2,4-dienoyl-CoA reductase-like NADH-dependent reductase (Old Yellow Enzyme family)
MAKLADTLHAEGTALFGQLYHPGGNMSGSPDGRRRVLYGPSENLSGRYHAMSRAMTLGEIEEAIQRYAQSARRMAEAGYDGVELYAGHGCLPAQFLDPALNRRTDGFGGCPENERRFLRDCVAAIRAEIGDMTVGVRLSPPDTDPMSSETPDLADICAALEAEAAVDYFSISAGSMRDVGVSVLVVPPMGIPAEQCLSPVAAVRTRVSRPVLAAGRIQTPAEAERILADGICDLVGLARPMICDPLWAQKSLAGNATKIRGCISCNQACIGHLHQGVAISCIQHPESGRELFRRDRPSLRKPRKVLVVGGGPAGMKAAAVAAARGHQVTLCEAGLRLGGQVILAQSLPGRAEFGGITENLAREMNDAGVEIRLSTRLAAQDILSFGADEVIVATGATEGELRVPGASSSAVLKAWNVLRGEIPCGARVLLADATCDWIGMGLAEQLAQSGHDVILASSGYMAGETLQKYVRDDWVRRLFRLQVDVRPFLSLAAFDDGTAFMSNIASGDVIEIEHIDTLIPLVGRRSIRSPGDELLKMNVAVHWIGDCLSPRTAEEAILEGLEAAESI